MIFLYRRKINDNILHSDIDPLSYIKKEYKHRFTLELVTDFEVKRSSKAY